MRLFVAYHGPVQIRARRGQRRGADAHKGEMSCGGYSSVVQGY